MTRLLLDPSAGDGGAPTPAPVPAPAASPAPVVPQAVQTVPVSVEELAKFYALQRELDDIKKGAAETERQKEEQRLLALAQKGEIETAFAAFKAQREDEINTLKGSILNGVKNDVISRSLLGVKWASDDAATDALDILGTRIEAVYDAAGNAVVRDKKTGLPATDVIKNWLADPKTAFYRAPSTTGGSGGTAGGSNPGGPPPSPMEQFASQMSQGFGLRPAK
jgi:hypothetical protein